MLKIKSKVGKIFGRIYFDTQEMEFLSNIPFSLNYLWDFFEYFEESEIYDYKTKQTVNIQHYNIDVEEKQEMFCVLSLIKIGNEYFIECIEKL